MSSNPYAPPKAALRDAVEREAAPALWNPNAASNWSLVFSPIFGALLQMKNWQALDEPEKASTSKLWVIANLVLALVLPSAAMVLAATKSRVALPQSLGFIPLIAWYVGNGRAQAAYVKERFGKDYPRRGWGAPILIAFIAMAGYVLLLLGFAFLIPK